MLGHSDVSANSDIVEQVCSKLVKTCQNQGFLRNACFASMCGVLRGSSQCMWKGCAVAICLGASQGSQTSQKPNEDRRQFAAVVCNMWLQHLLYCMLLYVIFKDPIQRWLDSRSWLQFLAACPVLSDVSGTVNYKGRTSQEESHQSSPI